MFSLSLNSITLNKGFIICNCLNLFGAYSNYVLNRSTVILTLFPIGIKLYCISCNFRASNIIGYDIANSGTLS